MGQHELVVDRRAPLDEPAFVGRLPETREQRTDEQLLDAAHAFVGRHLEGAQLDEAEPAGRAVGRVELVDAELGAMRVSRHVDEDVAQDAVDDPGRRLLARPRQLREGELELVGRVVARLVDTRGLGGRADEAAREQERERGMVVPIAQEAAEHVGAAQERALLRREAAEDDVVAAAGSDMRPVDLELLRDQALAAGRVVELLVLSNGVAPRSRRRDVDLDDAGVGRDPEIAQARIARRRVTLELDRQARLPGRRLDRGDELHPGLEREERRQEDLELAAARLDAERGAHDAGRRDPDQRPRVRRDVRERGGDRARRPITLSELRATVAAPALRPDVRALVAALQGEDELGRERRAGDRGIDLELEREIALRGPGQRVHRQPEAHRRVSGHQITPLGPQEPVTIDPAASPGERQDPAHDPVEPPIEDAREPRALRLVRELRVERIDVRRQATLAPEVVPDVLVRIDQAGPLQAEAIREARAEALRVGLVVAVVAIRVGDEGRVAPEG